MRNNGISSKEILSWILRAGGIVVLSILSPQLPHKLLQSYLKEKRRLKERLKQLEEKGWIKITEEGDNIKLELIEEGKRKAYSYDFDNLKIKIPKTWDGLWRMVIFDIPEEKKIARDSLRNKLKHLGFYQLQKSAFILPYDCKKEIEIIKNTYEIWPYVTYLVAKEIDREDNLKEKFDL
jgi:CRISPR-associated endonuclease Cas2